MNEEDARNRLSASRDASHRSARQGALGTAVITAALVIALGAVVDLEMLWLLGLVVLGFVALSVARPLKLRLDWSDRRGMLLFAASGLAVIAAYLLTQWLARSVGWVAPNTISAFASAVVIFAACLPALARLATGQAAVGRQRKSGDA
ncbi:hypothetical protein [Plantibacter sp. RU18]|uniref:hypothetical protein n=1 Tax=Plantibacter sp. RU18 TaxID=3158143 RepID=UPI003D361F2D